MDAAHLTQRHARRQRLTLLGGGALLLLILLPSWWQLRVLAARERAVNADIARLEAAILTLQTEQERFASDPTYVERLARQEFRTTREGEILLQMDDAADGPADMPGYPTVPATSGN